LSDCIGFTYESLVAGHSLCKHHPGVPQRQSDRRSGLATLLSVGAIP